MQGLGLYERQCQMCAEQSHRVRHFQTYVEVLSYSDNVLFSVLNSDLNATNYQLL